MTPDEVMAKPRFTRVFLLKSMEVQLEEEAAQAEAARQRQEQARREANNRRSRRR